jgi:ribosomal protein RSM22 (predicted rRNA methylase)
MLSCTSQSSACLRCSIRALKHKPSIPFTPRSRPRAHTRRRAEASVSARCLSNTPAKSEEYHGNTTQRQQDEEWNPLLDFRKARVAQSASQERSEHTSEVSADISRESDVKDDTDIIPDEIVDMSHEAAAILARNEFGDVLPENCLSDEALKIYKRLYGQPRIVPNSMAEDEEDPELQRQNEFGSWEPIKEEQSVEAEVETQDAHKSNRTHPMEPMELDQEAEDLQTSWKEDSDYVRTHPFTLVSRWGTTPSTLQLPKSTFIEPISDLLANTSNKHLRAAAESVFGGIGLPYSPSTPALSRTMPQKPVPLIAKQSRMSDMQANAFMAAIMPQAYAATTSILVEVRKRLGSGWLRGLMEKEGGPLVLDIASGGAAALAWRDIVKAEWDVVIEERKINGEKETSAEQPQSPPSGKITVVTGSDALRHRSSSLLDNTSFIPRLPDLVPDDLPDGAPTRKRYDIIIAPYSLWHIEKDYQRKIKIETLWSLLDPSGGVLILLEKGVPRGFEAIAGAREHLLTTRIRQPPKPAPKKSSKDDEPSLSSTILASSAIESMGQEDGMIIAPCTNHSVCPLYTTAGLGQGRKDWCHFKQRYHRPSFLQTILGAKRRNHDDVEFSYLAVRRGIDLRQELQSDQLREVEKKQPRVQIIQDEESTDRAYLGHGKDYVMEDEIQVEAEHQHDAGLGIFRDTDEVLEKPEESLTKAEQARLHATDREHWVEQGFDPLMLPRVLLTPIKRKGHILIDLCTPMGTYERWLVNRRTGKQAYRDARKSSWGDLWALGAHSRSFRRPNLGKVSKTVNGKQFKSKNGSPSLSREQREELQDLEEDERQERESIEANSRTE